jgi:ribosomal protein L37AE/L43A
MYINLTQAYKEELNRDKNFHKILGKDLGYIDKDCIVCGRHRVIKYSSGIEVCEKCYCDQQTKQTYENKYGSYNRYL